MDRMASIELALKNEASEMAFYQDNARRSKNPLAKGIFEVLANDEREHMTRIKGLHEALLAKGTWPKDVRIEVAGTNVKDVLEGLTKGKRAGGEHDDDDVRALERSAAFEARGAKFYAELAEACENPMEKTFFRFLSEIEKEHLLSVQSSLAYLQDPESWMMGQGRSGLDGA
jgi:rubrerythrin